MPQSSQNAPISSTRAFADLAAAIDRRVSSDRAADLLANFRSAVRAENRNEIAADFEAALLKTTDGDNVHDDFEVPAGEIRRIMAELRTDGTSNA